jgi:uncharacterized protein YfaS (alpha-2-macroglobulin family)
MFTEINKKALIAIIVTLSTVMITSILYVWIIKFNYYIEKKAVREVNATLEKNINISTCKKVIEFDIDYANNNNTFKREKFLDYKKNCDKKFNIKNISINLENCKKIIKSDSYDLEDNYIILDDFYDIQKSCTQKYLKIEFGTGSFFNVNNDFKSIISLDFSLPFFEDKWELWSDEYLLNIENAKKRLVKLLSIKPDVKINIEDIVLYPKKWLINLKLKPLTEYEINLKTFSHEKSNLKTKKEILNFKTPENKFLWIQIKNPVSLYIDKTPPSFELIKYNLPQKKETTLQICRIETEDYAKIEILRARKEATEERKNFFLNWIDQLETFKCFTKIINLESDNLLVRKKIDFSEEIWKPARSGLYYVNFKNKEDRNINNILSFPIFFWIIDSHITMKISKNWEWFFFVNDFEWKPLEWQNIRVYLNEFKNHTNKYNNIKSKREIIYNSPLDKSIFWKEILLWVTNKQWILKVNLEEKLEWSFEKTFNNEWNYKYNWINDSFFVKSSSISNLTYNHSNWNAWIAPWNFGYDIISGYYVNDSSNQNNISLSKYLRTEKEFYSHIYTDRILYLPWEEVNIKAIIRESKNLKIPNNKEFTIILKDSKNKEILNSKLKLSEYWSISEKFKLNKRSPTWNYKIYIKDDKWEYWRWNFSVEVFKNPKFKNEVSLETFWLNWIEVKIDKTKKDKEYYWRDISTWKFKIKWKISSKYYNWANVSNASYKYKIYKQYYYDSKYWNNCYWGCYWEPKKEFYSEWKWKLNKDWIANFESDISFESSYEDYKYIVEVTVIDDNWYNITGSNSIIAKLPEHLKKWNNNASLKFETENNFYKSWEKIIISWWLSQWKWTSDYNNKYLFVIKKKNYKTNYIDDVRGYKRPVNVSEEKLEQALLVNSKNFTVTKEWKLEFSFIPKESWEYVFEYGKINPAFNKLPNKKDKEKELNRLINIFNTEKKLELDNWVQKYYWIENSYDILYLIKNFCNDSKEKCSIKNIKEKLFCIDKKRFSWEVKITDNCSEKNVLEIKETILLDSLINTKKYFTILSYWNEDAQNPIISDNKVKVLSEKISYNLWDKARILIRLPFSKWKILWTVEKQGVIKKEYIDVNSNIFFKEVDVDDTFIPNAYIWIVAIEINNKKIPEYKIGYTEIVVDKTDKKSLIEIKTNKKVYKPREKVVLNISNKDKNNNSKKAELTVMVVDDSLISLMWNVDLNTLEKFYKKLPFQIQTSITNLAMLKNYYFSRPWIVWWSWFWNFKGWDSAVSTRNIFKNTAYFNPNVITDNNWDAKIEFTLPDNLTNFRIMVSSNSKDNFFWTASANIEVRRNITIEDKTPLFYRSWDRIEVRAKIFNNTSKEIGFKIKFDSDDIIVNKKEKLLVVWSKSSKIVSFWTSWKVDDNKDIKYKILALWDSIDNSDIIEKTIENKESPNLISVYSISWLAEINKKQNFRIDIPENTDLKKSKVKISFSNNLLLWVEKTIKSLLVYPYGCIEQMTSSTYPNAIILNFSKLFPWIINEKVAKENLSSWLQKIADMQTANWWFWYWPWDTNSNLHITPYVLRRLIDMKKFGAKIPNWVIEKATSYLETNMWNIIENVDKVETFYALSKIWKGEKVYNKLLKNTDKSKFTRHELISYTYWLITWDKVKNKNEIDKNILNIISKLNNSDSSYRYWSARSDKALFTSMIIDYWYNSSTITNYIKELYDIDWSNYYYSTTAKNNAFIAFSKYMNKYWNNSLSKFAFSIWSIHNRDDRFQLWEEEPNNIVKEFVLDDIIQYKENHIELTTFIISWKDIFTNLTLEIVPKNKLEIKDFSNWIKVNREVFEILDENKLSECSEVYIWNKKETADCSKIIKKVDNNEYKRWSKYKILIKVIFDSRKNRRNLALEDYIPSTFKVINSKFKTESTNLKNWTRKSWDWDHIEYLKDRVFANASSTWSDELSFEYIVTPEFSWEFIYPPVNAYMMYDWDIRAHSKFEKIIVK